MSGQNPETGGPSEEDTVIPSEEKEEKITHGEKARKQEEEDWRNSSAGELLQALEKQQAEDYNIAAALGMDLQSSLPPSREQKAKIIAGIKEISERTRERQETIKKLMEMKHLREMAAYHLASIGDWMEIAAKICRTDFEYDKSKPLVGQLNKMKELLPPEVYKLLEARAGEKWQDFEESSGRYNEIVAALKKEGDIMMAEKLEKLGVYDTQAEQ